MPSFTDEDIARRKSWLRLTAEDERALRDAHPVLVRLAPAIIDRFYEHLLSQEHTRKMLAEPGLVERLKGLQRSYFERLTAGDYGREYFEDRIKVGLSHERVGLDTQWYLGAYQRYLELVGEALRAEWPAGDPRIERTLGALGRVVMLDVSLAIETYNQRAQRRLAERNSELERLQRAKRVLTDMIVHDLQNPLTGIRAFLEFLQSSAPGLKPGELEALDEALRRCDDLGQMILNVRHVSRAEAGALETYVENLDLAEIVRRSVSAFALAAELDGRTVQVEGPSSAPFRSDQHLLKRVMYNLIRNALRHTPRGTRITVRVAADPGGPARIQVADDGPGIPPEAQRMLFDRFGSAALRAAGLRVDTGLGLAFCRAAMDALGGSIEVASNGARGTVFTLELPAP